MSTEIVTGSLLIMKINSLLKAILASFLALSCVTAQATPIVDNEKLLNQAVRDFLIHMGKQTTGMSGAIVKIDKCYKSSSTNKLYCLYYDYTARIYDAAVRELLGMEGTLDFFSDDEFLERIAKHVYFPKGSNFSESNAHLQMLFYKIQDRLNNP